MAAKDRKDLELTLEYVDISKVKSSKDSRHAVTVELIWPRLLVASKTAAKVLDFRKGVSDCSALPWTRRILFKESVEYRFGVKLAVMESMAEQKLEAFMRGVGSGLLGVGADVVESAIPGVLGEVAAVPLDTGKKTLAKTADADTILEGFLDMDASCLTEGLAEIPLVAKHNTYKTIATHGPRDTLKSRKLVVAEGALVGLARIKVTLLK